MPDVIRDPFHRAIASLIQEQIEMLEKNLSHGSATQVSEDTATVGEKYAAAISYIRALEMVLELCHQVELNQESLGPRPANVKVVER